MRDFSSVLPPGTRRNNMTIAEVLKKATEGGYHIDGSDGTETFYEGANSDFSAWTRKDNGSTFMVAMEETFLDPAFWQALGYALGWQEACDLCITCAGTQSVSVVAAPTGCTSGIVLFRHWRTGTLQKPSLCVSPLLSNVSLLEWDWLEG
jgi:hypothetical protein